MIVNLWRDFNKLITHNQNNFDWLFTNFDLFDHLTDTFALSRFNEKQERPKQHVVIKQPVYTGAGLLSFS